MSCDIGAMTLFDDLVLAFLETIVNCLEQFVPVDNYFTGGVSVRTEVSGRVFFLARF